MNQRTRTQVKWGFVWAGWIAYFAVAERAALRSREPCAPFTTHMCFALGVSSHPIHRFSGQLTLAAGSLWLADHLYRRAKP